MINKSAIVCAVGLFVSANVMAEDNTLEQLPVIPEPLADGQSIEPDIEIIQKEDRTIQEYRMNGRLYMIKVVPSIGVPYYLVDTDGDGSFESSQHGLDSGLLIPSWILFEW